MKIEQQKLLAQWKKMESPWWTDLPLDLKPGEPFELVFHESWIDRAYYDLDIHLGNLPAIAEFVLAGLPRSIGLRRDEDFVLHCNWPEDWQHGGKAELYQEAAEILGADGMDMVDTVLRFEDHDRQEFIESLVREKLARLDHYLPEAVFADEDIYHWLPLNVDIAVRLMRKDQIRFRRIFDMLLMDASRKELEDLPRETYRAHPKFAEYEKAVEELTEVANRIIKVQIVGLDDNVLRPHMESKPLEVLACLPSSVTWAWRQLLDALEEGTTYDRCANPRCQKLYEKGRRNQKHCSLSCTSAHKQQRYRDRQAHKTTTAERQDNEEV